MGLLFHDCVESRECLWFWRCGGSWMYNCFPVFHWHCLKGLKQLFVPFKVYTLDQMWHTVQPVVED